MGGFSVWHWLVVAALLVPSLAYLFRRPGRTGATLGRLPQGASYEAGGSDDRADGRTERAIGQCLAAALGFCVIALALDLNTLWPRLLLYREQYMAAMLSLSLPLVFLRQAGRGAPSGNSANPFDHLLAVVSFSVAAYAAYLYPEIAESLSARAPDTIALAVVLLALVIEAVRRIAGLPTAGVVVAFVALGASGDIPAFETAIRATSLEELAAYLAWDSTGALGLPLTIVAYLVGPFIILRQTFLRAGGSYFVEAVLAKAMGESPAGQARAAVLHSVAIGALSVDAESNVRTIGTYAIPRLQDAGFPSRSAAGIEAAAAVGGQLSPPILGGAVFVIAEFLEIGYEDLTVSIMIPAALFLVALLVMVNAEARLHELPRFVARRSGVFTGVIVPVGALILVFAAAFLGIVMWNLPPGNAALYASAILAVLASTLNYRGVGFGGAAVWAVLVQAGSMLASFVVIAAAIGLIIGVLNISGLGFAITLGLAETFPETWQALSVAAALCIVVGLGLPTIFAVMLSAVLVGPALIEIGVAPVAAYLFILYFSAMSAITPPFARAAFAAAETTGDSPLATALASMRFAWAGYAIPFLIVFAPGLFFWG